MLKALSFQRDSIVPSLYCLKAYSVLIKNQILDQTKIPIS